LLTLAALWSRPGDPAQAAPPPIEFNRQVLPILADHCFACHGPDAKKRKAKLRLDTREGAFASTRGGGRALTPGQLQQSEVVERITTADETLRMPPPGKGKPLSPAQIALVQDWVEQGAKWSAPWFLTAPHKVTPPAVADATWARNDIDRFILARLEKEGLKPAPEADPVTWLRRVTLDLTGLPPTPAEVDEFVKDAGRQAAEQVVDRLLASPRYGEHMARYWLDVARYGDTHGLHLDNYREIWPYRDWVINAFNHNMPYDRFLTEQLAGDLLPRATLDQQIATGFIRCSVTTNEGGSIDEEWHVRNAVDRLDTTGTVFLGMSVGCARCHDHKYDPLRTKEYYQLFAFFNSIDGPPLDGNAAQHAPVVRVASPEQLAALEALKKKADALRHKIAAELAQVKFDESELVSWLRLQEGKGGAGLPRPVEAAIKVRAAKRNDPQKKQLRDHFLEHVCAKTRLLFDPLHRELSAAEKELAELEKTYPTTLVFKESAQPRPAYILKRGEYDQRGDRVERNTPAALPPMPADAPKNRLGLARWLLLPEHPLTARVQVNRLWQQVFGTGLVKTAEDFGTQGEPASHPEVLDYLAVQFREDGWDMKMMMKRLVTSAAYRQSSKTTPGKLARDPDNRLLSRGPRYRLDAETVRDQALFVSGLLVEKLGGPSVKLPQPPGIWEAVGYLTSNTRNFAADTGHEKVHRRSLYTFWKRTAPPPQMASFDAPSRESCRVRRERTNTPLQALVLLNDIQFLECARVLAERTMKEVSPADRLPHLFRLVLARQPDSRERDILQRTYQDHQTTYHNDVEAAKKLIGVGETKADPKLDAAELAALTMIGNLVLNLDETVTKE
jgi:mono/diheme cytochrome c family protein